MSLITFDVFGNNVACLSDQELATRIEGWAGGTTGHVVCFNDAHASVQGHDNPSMQQALRSADLLMADGYPIAWMGRVLHGLPVAPTCGPDFLDLMAARSAASGLSHYLFGGKPGVAEELRVVLQQRYPGIRVVGVDAPPMGLSSPEEIDAQLNRIVSAKPNVVWVALGAPKQEIWMARHRDRLPGLTLCGVGAAFDFHTGKVRRAPAWMRRSGLEWLHRVYSEPRRLAYRYGTTIPRFAWLFLSQTWRMARHGKLQLRARLVPRRT